MSRRTAVVVVGTLGFCLGGRLFAEDQKRPSMADKLAGARRTTQGLTNDNCEDAISLFDGSTDFDTTGANTDGLPHESCQFDGQTYNDIWYSYIATCSGNLNLHTCYGLFYDSDLVVYSGCPPEDWVCPPGDDELLGCNDDTVNCGPAFGSSITVPVVLGNCYTVRVGGWNNSDMGAGTLTLTYYECKGFCGDGICQPEEGEDECSCSQDCPRQCPTDVDGSGDTGPFDLAVLLGSWGPCAPGEACSCLDANDDGTIGAEDLAVLLGAWGPCG